MTVLEPYKGGYYLWKYLPSSEAAGVATALFAVLTGAYCWRIWRTRSWFCIPFPVGGLMSVIGYGTRATAREKTAKLMPYAIQNTMILLAPVLFAAAIYMTLGRAIRSSGGERHSLIRPAWLTKLFVSGDVLSLMVQGGAAGLMVTGGSQAKTGQNIIIGGLALQVLIFGLFCAAAFVFHLRMRRDPVVMATERAPDITARGGVVHWRQTLRVLYVVSGLVMGRSVFRVIEFSMGQDGYLLSTEWPLYVFDALPMLTVMAVFWWWFPSAIAKPASWGEVTSLSDLNTISRGGAEVAERERMHKGAA
ncbi:RTA1 like protein-domain-containing protein [Lasiosphaeria ovina]|uniref:RTA1 like protein-domain-containing protein n=1 Tax=Lasiosphaeria ovina TaxID=92902 RepID=A0AAE0MYN2_9PEZI|nr:RTA1 like protein-domain-containing protein [Lasiosphaeria ovina]